MSPDVPSHRAVSKEAKQWTSLVSAGGMAVWTAKGVDGRRGPHKPRGMRIPGTSQIRVNYLWSPVALVVFCGQVLVNLLYSLDEESAQIIHLF